MGSESIPKLILKSWFQHILFSLANNRIVPKGSNVLIPILPMHYNDEIFDEPREFRPERHLEERSMKNVNPFAYVPFSAGPRNCKFSSQLKHSTEIY